MYILMAKLQKEEKQMKFLWKPITILIIIAIGFTDLKMIVDYEIIRPLEKENAVTKTKTAARILDLSDAQPEEVFGPSFEEKEEVQEEAQIDQEEIEKEVQKIVDQAKLEELEAQENVIDETPAEEIVEEVTEEVIETPQEEAQETTENTVVETGSLASDIVSTALQYEGWNYVSGGSSPETGFDCSGFTKYIFGLFGIYLNRVSGDQADNGTPVERGDLQPGDLLLFSYYGSDSIGHSGIYIGNGQMIHAANSSRGVTIDTIESGYYDDNYVTARRLY